jgi:hypothetical protein
MFQLANLGTRSWSTTPWSAEPKTSASLPSSLTFLAD